MTMPDLHPWPKGTTLDGARFAMVRHHRLLASSWARLARRPENAEGAVVGVLLWFEALRLDPAGVLPDDDEALCDIAGLGGDLERWRRIRPVALYNWMPCLVSVAARPDGFLAIDLDDPSSFERGLWHPEVHRMAESALGALRSQSAKAAGSSAAAERKRRERVRQKIVTERLCHGHPPEDGVAWVADHLAGAGLSITPANVRAAWVQWKNEKGAKGEVIALR